MASDNQRNEDCAHRIIGYVLENWAENPAQGLEAVLVGSPDTPEATATEKGEEAREEPFWSVRARQLDLLSFLFGRLIADLEKTELYPLWTSGGPDFDRDVARALWQQDSSQRDSLMRSPAQPKLPAQAVAMAQVIGRYQELARKVQNQFSHLEPFSGALVSNCHDPLRLQRAGKAEWIAFIQPLLDARWLEGRADLREVLDDAWELIVQTGSVDLEFRFREADGWTDYNARFGFGSLREAVVAGLERATRRAGMFEVLGTEPEEYLKGVLFSLRQGGVSIDEEAEARLEIVVSGLGPVRPLGLHHPALELDIAESVAADLIDLGSALFPEPEDLPALATDVPFRGTSLFAAVDADLEALAGGSGIGMSEHKADFAGAVSVFCRAIRATLAECFVALDNPPGRATELLRQFLKLNVFSWWREATRRAALLALRSFVSDALRRPFDELDPAFAAALSLYGMTAAGWETQGADSIAGAALKSYTWERLMFIMLKPDAPNHAKLGRGIADLTAEGELLRFIAQFRDFRAPAPPKPLAHPAAERETDRAMQYALAGGDVLAGTVNLLIWLVLFERLASLAADAGQGGAPSAADLPWFESALNGGTLGLCADFLFGETTGLKVVPLSGYATMRHPAIASALAIWRQARYGEDMRAALANWADKEGDEGSLDTLQLTRQALNYALRHHLQDMMSPGYLPRTLKDMEAQAAKSYWRMPGAGGSTGGGSGLH